MKTKMKHKLLAGALILLSQNISSQTKWVDLFNGKNLNGWQVICGSAPFKVESGEIVGTYKLNTPNTFLATKKDYSDFILEFEFKVDEGANSGVQFRSLFNTEEAKGKVCGYQFEIDPSERAWTGGIYDESRRGWLYSLKDFPEAKSALKNGEWNKARIEALGENIKTFVNGYPCANLIDNKTSKGFIALQVHSIHNANEEGKTIRWRNIRICTKDLPKQVMDTQKTARQITTIPNTLSEDDIKDGWKLLWDGKTTEGWRGAKLTDFPTSGWKINDDMLMVLRGDGGESTNGGDIVTTKKYKNFELCVDFKITEGANSGIKYFVNTDLNKGEGSSIGCEFQILDDEKHPDSKKGVNGNRQLGALYDLIPPMPNKPYKKGKFNTARIVVVDDHVEHWLNGVKILEYDRNTQMFNALVAYSKYKVWDNFGNAKEGHILLQDHGDDVMYQNVKIKELP